MDREIRARRRVRRIFDDPDWVRLLVIVELRKRQGRLGR